MVAVGEVRVLDERRCEVGEGPVWHAASGRVFWVDVLARHIMWCGPGPGDTGAVAMPSHVGAVVPTEHGDWLACLVDGLYRTDLIDDSLSLIAVYPGASPELVRANDAKVAPDGRVFTGTMAYDPDANPGAGALYVLEDASLATVFTGVTISNGIGWSPDAAHMYFVDSPTRRVDICDMTTLGNVVDRRPFAVIPEEIGVPDGLTVDAAGNVWVAIWGGSRVMIFAPDGSLIGEVPMPTPLVTSCAFVGSDLNSLVITTAALDRPDDPHAGKTYVLENAGPGQPQPLAHW